MVDYELLKRSPKLAQTIIAIDRYLKSKGYKWFTYTGLRFFVDRFYSDELDWHTVERYIRKMVELGLLERKEYVKKTSSGARKRVGFYPTELFRQAVRILRDYGIYRE